jgi:uroporphyrinogen decarboxylase
MNKREWVLKVLDGDTTERTPVAFWFHFTADELVDAFVDPTMTSQCLSGTDSFFGAFQPDLLKIMTDGFFMYPNREFQKARTASDLRRVASIGADHPWIVRQVEYARAITSRYGSDVLCFFNVFSASNVFRFVRMGDTDAPASPQACETLLCDMLADDAAAVAGALDVVAGDLCVLARRLIEDGGVDGLYFSAQGLADARFTADLQRDVIGPADIRVLEAANAAKSRLGRPLNILHVCGYDGHRNSLEHYVDYPAQIVNWASVVEGVPLAAGKRIFGGRPIIGGFANTVDGVLFGGTEQQIKDEAKRLLADVGRKGVIIGADCSLPRGLPLQHLQWVREAVNDT